MGRHVLGDCNDNGERFAAIYRFYLLEQRPCYKISWVSTDRQFISNKIDHIAISSRFRSCLLNMRKREMLTSASSEIMIRWSFGFVRPCVSASRHAEILWMTCQELKCQKDPQEFSTWNGRVNSDVVNMWLSLTDENQTMGLVETSCCFCLMSRFWRPFTLWLPRFQEAVFCIVNLFYAEKFPLLSTQQLRVM